MLLLFQAIPDIPDDSVSNSTVLMSLFLTIGGNVFIAIRRHRDEKERRQEALKQQEEPLRRQEEARMREVARQRILANGLRGTDDVSNAVFHWLQRHEGQTVIAKVHKERRGACIDEKDIEWTIPPFEVVLSQDCFDRVNYGCHVVYSLKSEYSSEDWKFPPETWHEADLSDDKLVYSLGWRLEYSAEMGESEVSVTARSWVNYWSHWTLTAQTPKVA